MTIEEDMRVNVELWMSAWGAQVRCIHGQVPASCHVTFRFVPVAQQFDPLAFIELSEP